MNRSRLTRVFLPLTLAAGLLALGGCQVGESHGRIGVTDTTDAEAHSNRVLPAALIEFSDQVPQHLVQDMNNPNKAPQLAKMAGPITVVMGDINNKTQVVSSNDFEILMQRLRNRLINSSAANKKFVFVESRARMSQLAQREGIGSPDNPAGPEAYNPKTTVILTGDFYRMSRGDTTYYYMQVNITDAAGNHILFQDSYDSKRIIQN